MKLALASLGISLLTVGCVDYNPSPTGPNDSRSDRNIDLVIITVPGATASTMPAPTPMPSPSPSPQD